MYHVPAEATATSYKNHFIQSAPNANFGTLYNLKTGKLIVISSRYTGRRQFAALLRL